MPTFDLGNRPRISVTIDKDQAEWLDHEAELRSVPISELVRDALALMMVRDAVVEGKVSPGNMVKSHAVSTPTSLNVL